jgi:putative transposase
LVEIRGRTVTAIVEINFDIAFKSGIGRSKLSKLEWGKPGESGRVRGTAARGSVRAALLVFGRQKALNELPQTLPLAAVRVHAYVLMSNHFHLIIQTPKANLSEFMRQFNISYTGYYNRRHRRSVHLYQGRFKAVVVDKDSYLLELSRYVHLNPVRIKAKAQRPESERIREISRYRWSSLPGYLEGKRKASWVTYEVVLGYVGGSRQKYAGFVQDGIREGFPTPWEDLRAQMVLGDRDFVKKAKRNEDQRKR